MLELRPYQVMARDFLRNQPRAGLFLDSRLFDSSQGRVF